MHVNRSLPSSATVFYFFSFPPVASHSTHLVKTQYSHTEQEEVGKKNDPKLAFRAGFNSFFLTSFVLVVVVVVRFVVFNFCCWLLVICFNHSFALNCALAHASVQWINKTKTKTHANVLAWQRTNGDHGGIEAESLASLFGTGTGTRAVCISFEAYRQTELCWFVIGEFRHWAAGRFRFAAALAVGLPSQHMRLYGRWDRAISRLYQLNNNAV